MERLAVGGGGLQQPGFVLATSPDGITWTQQAAPPVPQGGEAVAWNGQTWLVGGTYFGGVLRSADGITWTLVPGPISTVWALGADGIGGWVALGYDAANTEIAALSSDDGSNWTTSPLALFTPMSLTYNGATWLGGGAGGVLISNDGGINWLPWWTGISGGGVTWTGTEWVSVGIDGNGDGYAVKSPDAISWGTLVPLQNDGRDVAFRRPIYPPWP
jgi:hypothetical protein